ncbi:MAG: outer membrane lipoprotein-sorting protein [Deltaproteobacteria bacterium]|nr:MAG: outer membrane lipoprotein-sorting protein [Deltaproteobacteria bacterium]
MPASAPEKPPSLLGRAGQLGGIRRDLGSRTPRTRDHPLPRRDQAHYPILEPFDLKGVGGLGNRHIDPARPDDQWLYLPSLRRVRRLSTAQRSDALFGQDTDTDSFYGYSGHIAWTDFKYLGERDLIGALHAQHPRSSGTTRSTGRSTTSGRSAACTSSRASPGFRSTPTQSG